MTLTEKESTLLKDLKDQEALCAEKYERAAEAAVDGQLKGLFTALAENEREHLKTLNEIECRTPPAPSCTEKPLPSFTQTYTMSDSPDKTEDCFLCTDMLTAEKHASSLYDTCIFEFGDEAARKCLNHIQKEEQEHGKMVYDYMKANNMY
ncbi:MAG: spore coat protein [Clostridia bacterium]|nr:spore coat protein [Clostridia bacterium]